MTSAAPPAMSGADWLVPPNCWSGGRGAGLEVGAFLVDVGVRACTAPSRPRPARPGPSVTAVLGRSRADSIDEMLSFSQLLAGELEGVRRRPARSARKFVLAAGGDHGRVARRRSSSARSTPESPVLCDDGDAGGRRPASLNWRVRSCARVRDRVAAEGLAEHVGVVVRDRVVQPLEDQSSRTSRARVAEHLHPDQRGAGRDAADADVAARRQRVRGIDELREVVDLPALGGDRAGVAERLGRAGHGRSGRRR